MADKNEILRKLYAGDGNDGYGGHDASLHQDGGQSVVGEVAPMRYTKVKKYEVPSLPAELPPVRWNWDRIMGMRDQYLEDDAVKAKRERRERAARNIAAVSDAIQALGILAAGSRGGYTPKAVSASEKVAANVRANAAQRAKMVERWNKAAGKAMDDDARLTERANRRALEQWKSEVTAGQRAVDAENVANRLASTQRARSAERAQERKWSEEQKEKEREWKTGENQKNRDLRIGLANSRGRGRGKSNGGHQRKSTRGQGRN
jgi:hypothetical protein